MSFKTVLFSTYIGYFIQVLPFAAAAGIAGFFIKYFSCRERSFVRAAFAGLFTGYIAALLCLVFAIDSISAMWSRFAFAAENGVQRLTANGSRLALYAPAFLKNLSGEQLGNILLFMPLGLLYPLSRKKAWLIETVAIGFAISLAIELIQPLAGRVRDISDLSMNTFGTLIGAAVIHPILFMLRRLFSSREGVRCKSLSTAC